MRRLLSLLLLAGFGVPFWAPLLALGQAPESSLPACCRRDGKHHCVMSMALESQAAASRAPRWKAPPERCPFCPGTVSASFHSQAGAPARQAPGFGQHLAAPQGRAQTEARRRVARDRSRHKRGPPAPLLT